MTNEEYNTLADRIARLNSVLHTANKMHAHELHYLTSNDLQALYDEYLARGVDSYVLDNLFYLGV